MASNRRWKRLVGLLFVSLIWGASAVLAAVPAEINYQGRLEDMTGPVNGTFTLMFRLFDAQTGGSPLWEEAQSVSVDQGIYNVILGTGTLNPLYSTLEDVVLGNDDLWFEVQVFGESDAMSPRQKLTSVGFAMRAGSVSVGAITATMLAADAVTTDKLVDGAVTAAKVTGGFVPDLDADKLDGMDAASFAPSTHNHDSIYYSKSEVDALVSGYEARLAALEDKLQYLTVVAGSVNEMPGPHVMITGANLHVTSGSGSTNGPINGLGNLIVGYNELRGSGDDRTGSHNIVSGNRQNYTAFGGLVVGVLNTISAPYATVSGGISNTASGNYSSLSGGYANTASDEASSVSGGIGNTASSIYSSVSGGYHNTANGPNSSVSGGWYNLAAGDYSSVSGGGSNEANGNYSSVSGGVDNNANGDYSSLSGGRYNDASGNYSSVSGGSSNSANSDYSSVSGGWANDANGLRASVSGGHGNDAGGDYSSISGGYNRSVTGDYDWRAGGYFQDQ